MMNSSDEQQSTCRKQKKLHIEGVSTTSKSVKVKLNYVDVHADGSVKWCRC